MRNIAIDTEVFYSSKLKYSLKNQIAEQFCRDPKFDCYMLSVSDGSSSWAGEPKDFNWGSLEGATLLSHNAYWDRTCVEEMQRRGLAPKFNYKDWLCTANLTAYLCNRRALAQAIEHLTGRVVSKEVRAEANGRHWKDFLPAERQAMMKYALGDAKDCHWLFEKYGPQWPEWERQLSSQTIRQGMRGVQIDVPLLKDYLLRCHEMKVSTEALLPWLDAQWDEEDEFNQKPTSTKCIAEQCHRKGIPCPPIKAHEGEEAFQEWERTYGPRHPWIPALSSWRSVNKLYKTLELMLSRVRPDNTMPFALKYCGAHTRRWSGDANLNFQNFRKIPVVCNDLGLMETDDDRVLAAMAEQRATGKLPEWVRGAIDMRKLILPRQGQRMITCDLAQIEARVLNYLAGNHALLESLKGGMSVYESHARETMGWSGGNLKKENAEVYALSKARVLGLGFGCGWEKFITLAKTMCGLDITSEDPEWEQPPSEECPDGVPGYGMNSRRIVQDFRNSNPKITAIWDRLDRSFKSSIGGDFTITLPSGNKLRYNAVRCETRIEPDRKTKKPTRKSVFTADTDGRRRIMYGGLLTENLVQATARDLFGTHLLALDKADPDCVMFSCHDEAIVSTDSLSVEDVESIMSQTPEWLAGCPVSAEGKEVPHYTK